MQGLTYNVDIVMCIDCTGSMGGILKTVKNNALKFYGDLQGALSKKSKTINTLRLKVIAFRDFYVDGDNALTNTEFLTIPDEESSFSAFVNKLSPEGGGDEPENGLEALALAIGSDWNDEGDKQRQIVVVWTDASAHKLEVSKTKSASNYPSGMPANFDEITDVWDGQEGMRTSAKRLIMFTPDAYPWTDIANFWENTIHYPSKAGAGLSDVDYNTILDSIVQSI